MKRTILITTLIAGTLDILAAFIRSYVTDGVPPSTVLKYIASGAFGIRTVARISHRFADIRASAAAVRSPQERK